MRIWHQVKFSKLDVDNLTYKCVYIVGIKRRRSTQLRPRREVSKKEPRKKNQNSGDPKTKRQTAFSRICVLSNELHDLTGKRYMRRSDVVKWMWNYFNTNNLKDPKNKQMILLDDRLKTVRSCRIIGQVQVIPNS